jgi:hypothetical protein
MPIITPQNVQPGDLITSEFMNLIIDALRSLELRISNLEAGESTGRPPVLIGRSPSGDVEVNSLLTVVGRNFSRPSELNTVMLGGVPINQFSDSDDRNLHFTVPNVFAGLPREVSLSVRNEFGEAPNQLQVRLLPRAQPQGGQVVIFNQTAALGEILEGNTYDLAWLVDSQTVLPVTYNVTLEFSSVVGASQAAWRAASVIVPSGSQEIRRGSPLRVTARVTVPPGATSAQVALRAESQDGTFSRTSDSLDFTVGQTIEVSDPRVLITLVTEIPPFDSSGAPNPVRGAVIGGVNGIELRFGSSGQVPINVHVIADSSATGTYRFSTAIEDPAGMWVAGSVTPAQAGQTAPSDRTVQATLQNIDTGLSTMVKFAVVRATHLTSTGADDFVSFVRFPIRGFAA